MVCIKYFRPIQTRMFFVYSIHWNQQRGRSEKRKSELEDHFLRWSPLHRVGYLHLSNHGFYCYCYCSIVPICGESEVWSMYSIISSADPCIIGCFSLGLFLSTDTDGMGGMDGMDGWMPMILRFQRYSPWRWTKWFNRSQVAVGQGLNIMESTFGSSVELFALDKTNKTVTWLDKWRRVGWPLFVGAP